MNILVTGGNGYIARSLARGLENKHTITSIARKDFDLIDSRATNSWFDEHSYDVVIHTAISGGSRLANDGVDALDNNLRMHYNLLSNSHKFGKLITFGSGAEMYSPNTPYGLSKKIIADTIRRTDNWYNLRIFGVFDENELNTRFVKRNLIRYINKQPMVVHSHKTMDFFYMKDLVSLVKYYLNNINLPKEIDCCYEEKLSLLDVANIINSTSNHRVPIEILSENQELYCSVKRTPLPIEIIGLRRAITETYQAIVN